MGAGVIIAVVAKQITSSTELQVLMAIYAILLWEIIETSLERRYQWPPESFQNRWIGDVVCGAAGLVIGFGEYDWWTLCHIAAGALLGLLLRGDLVLPALIAWELFELWGHHRKWSWEPAGWWEYESIGNRWGSDIVAGLLGALFSRMLAARFTPPKNVSGATDLTFAMSETVSQNLHVSDQSEQTRHQSLLF